jgi:hypothetical protein
VVVDERPWVTLKMMNPLRDRRKFEVSMAPKEWEPDER